MSEIMEFADRAEFRAWLHEHCQSEDGVWLLFGKAGGPKTIKAGEALEERGLMTDFGRRKIEEAQKNGQWYAPNPMAVTQEQIDGLSALLEGYGARPRKFPGHASVGEENLYAGISGRQDGGRAGTADRLVLDRLNQNLRPM